MPRPLLAQIGNPSEDASRRTSHSSHPSHSRSCIPCNHHLLITTPGAIYAWDRTGVRKIFKSSKNGILAAKASKDGSNVLAVADSQVVILHDCRRRREESWGLSSSDGHVRLLEYAPDAESLFLTTTITGAVQCYSVRKDRMSRPAQDHPSPPTVLAVNVTTQLMISASEHPPTVYIQNLRLETPAHRLSIRASQTAVVVASFHPELPNIFLLGFKDGTLAFYDAAKLARRNGNRMDVNASLNTDAKKSEIMVFKRLHRTTNRGSVDGAQGDSCSTSQQSVGEQSVGVVAASFIPGYLSRAISLGGDGQCRTIDFSSPAKVLRAWSVSTYATSLAVLATTRLQRSKGQRDLRTISQRQPGQLYNSGPDCIVAVGRHDGTVILYNINGLQMQELSVEGSPKILDLEWARGDPPREIGELDLRPRHAVFPPRVILTDSSDETVTEVSLAGRSVTQMDNQETDAREKSQRSSRSNTPSRFSPRSFLKDKHHVGTVIRTPQAAMLQERTHMHLAPDLFSSQGYRTAPRAIRLSQSPERPRITSRFFDRQSHNEETCAELAEHSSGTTNFSEPVELDPNLTLSYLTDPSQQDFAGKTPHQRQSKVFMVTPGYSITTSSKRSLSSESWPSTKRIAEEDGVRRSLMYRKRMEQRWQRSVTPQAALLRLNKQHTLWQRPSFITHMNRTGASDIRKKAGANASKPPYEATRMEALVDNQPSEMQTWADFGSETQDAVVTTPAQTTAPQGIGNLAEAGHHSLPSLKTTVDKLSGLHKPPTMYYDAPTCTPTRQSSGLLQTLSKGRGTNSHRPLTRSALVGSRGYVMSKPDRGTVLLPTEASNACPRPLRPDHSNQFPKPPVVPIHAAQSPRPVNERKASHGRHRLPELPGQFPTSTSEDAKQVSIVAPQSPPSHIDGHGDFSPSSSAIRQLCPRGSSLAPAEADLGSESRDVGDVSRSHTHPANNNPASAFNTTSRNESLKTQTDGSTVMMEAAVTKAPDLFSQSLSLDTLPARKLAISPADSMFPLCHRGLRPMRPLDQVMSQMPPDWVSPIPDVSRTGISVAEDCCTCCKHFKTELRRLTSQVAELREDLGLQQWEGHGDRSREDNVLMPFS